MKTLSNNQMAQIEAGTRCSRLRLEYLQAIASGNFYLALLIAVAYAAQGCGPLS